MKKFSFRLQKVLDLREAVERKKLGEFGSEQIRLDHEKEKLGLFCREEETHVQAVRTEQAQPFRVWTQKANHQYLKRIEWVIEFQEGQVQTQTRAVATARLNYIEARRDTRTIEQLRTQKLQEWTIESSREEDKMLDEFAGRMHSGGKEC
jgi:flagellar FliJ protein